HARAFGDTINRDGFSVMLNLLTKAFRARVSGHDALPRLLPASFGQLRQGFGNHVDDFIYRQWLTNNARRKWQDLLRLYTGTSGNGFASRQSIAQALLTGTGVSVTGVNQQIADRRRRQML